MGHLTVISETGMFHSAVLFEIDTGRRREWRGFHPRTHHAPMGGGEVDRTDREPYINHYARFAVADATLLSALQRAEQDWATAYYTIGVQDCVSMSADVARACGLVVPRVNMTPYGLVSALVTSNRPTHHDTWPLPWKA